MGVGVETVGIGGKGEKRAILSHFGVKSGCDIVIM